jgi:hypothetical protein
MPVKSNPKRYPRWIPMPDGTQHLVHDHMSHSSIAGVEYDENAELVTAQTREVPVDPVEVIDDTEDDLIEKAFNGAPDPEPTAPLRVKRPYNRKVLL